MEHQHVYDPLEYVKNYELLTFVSVGSFVTWKLLNVMYEQLYEPIIDIVIPKSFCEKHIIKIKNNKIQVGYIYKEIIKWLVLIILLMILHNIISRTMQ